MRDEVKKTTNEEDGEEDKILSEIEEEQVRFYEKEKYRLFTFNIICIFFKEEKNKIINERVFIFRTKKSRK